jgi:predicted dehydrogenase
MPTVGLVGCGNWGKNILRDLLSLNCTVYVATRGENSQALATEMGAQKVLSSSDELPECDGYVLAVPIDSLADEALKLIPRGKPIFSEKTLCPTMREAHALREAGADGQVFLMHKWEYHKGIHALQKIAASGQLGKLEQIRCHREGWVEPWRKPDALTLLAIHDLTIIRHILGEWPEPKHAVINHRNGIPVSVTAIMGGSVSAILSADGRYPEHFRSVTVIGETSTALLSGAYAEQIVVKGDCGEEKVSFEQNMPLYDELEEFIGYLKGGPAPRCGFEHAVSAAKTLDQIRACADSINNTSQ